MLGISVGSTKERVDLSEDSGFFLDLLDSTNPWRERLVSELRFGSRNHVRVVSSYQVDFPPALLERYRDLKLARRANVLLPLTTRPKRQLLNFSLSGPSNSPATLTSRASIAALQAQYLKLLAETSDASDALKASVDPQLYESICVFTPGFFQSTFLRNHDGDIEEPLAQYLSSGFGWDVSTSDVKRWREQTTQAGKILSRHLQEPPDEVSSSEEVLLALPLNSQCPGSVEEVDRLIDGFIRGLDAADQASDRQFLVALAEYGRRYELVVEVELPLLEPSRIKVEEDVPLELEHRLFRSWVGQSFPLGDARSSHLEVRVDDPNVEVTGYEIKDLLDRDASGWIESIRYTREALAIYGSDPGRPYFAMLWLRIGVTRPLVVAASLLLLVNIAAIVLVPFVGFSGPSADHLAVLAIPATVAATFALVRDQTALAARLQWIPRLLLATTTVVLWLEVVLGLAVFSDDGSPQSPAARPDHPPELIDEYVRVR
jgi:hypothetical protein